MCLKLDTFKIGFKNAYFLTLKIMENMYDNCITKRLTASGHWLPDRPIAWLQNVKTQSSWYKKCILNIK